MLRHIDATRARFLYSADRGSTIHHTSWTVSHDATGRISMQVSNEDCELSLGAIS